MARVQELSLAEYQALAEFRHRLRRFLHFSEQAARGEGLAPQHHQLLLAIKGSSGATSIGALAEMLQLAHHSAVELIDRTQRAGLVQRIPDAEDRRRVSVALTSQGEAVLRKLSLQHREELRQAAPRLMASLRWLDRAASARDVSPRIQPIRPPKTIRKEPTLR